jgi:hypothetical protein
VEWRVPPRAVAAKAALPLAGQQELREVGRGAVGPRWRAPPERQERQEQAAYLAELAVAAALP